MDEAAAHLPVCLEEIRSKVSSDVLKILILQQSLEMISIGSLWKYYCSKFCSWSRSLRKSKVHEAVAPALLQIIHLQEYSATDLSGIDAHTPPLPLQIIHGCVYDKMLLNEKVSLV